MATQHFPPRSLGIKILTIEDRISADSGSEEPSAVYYGGATGAVPFIWESQPGTPKHNSSHAALPPPLSPPPSHLFSPRTNFCHKKNSNFSNSIISRIPSKKVTASSSVFSSSSLSSSSCPHVVSLGTSPSSMNSNKSGDMGYDPRKISPSSKTCFCPLSGSLRKIRGYCMKSVKKLVLSIVG
ncbi:hypothetical protein F511_09196 [Dorcoceras hygrometricum]|uniref:Uncharacterized protein n=1 Tax=Dorcoceras hygrometricum TaxID=472368 RepID=A0A2Z7CXU1_9LAMI|nr:hypothetical protein F511_09196 [Dorcoceras hygrometricum]